MLVTLSSLMIFIISFAYSQNPNIIERDGCGPGWDLPLTPLNTKESYCYKFTFDQNVSYNWFEAWHNCKQEKGDLMQIESAEESNWLWNVITLPAIAGTHFDDIHANGWYLNAHKKMYGIGTPSWVDGRSIYAGLGVFYSSISDSGWIPRGEVNII